MSIHRNNDPYLDKVSGTLKNKLRITDPEKLELVEGAWTATRSYELQQTPLQGADPTLLSPGAICHPVICS